MTHEQRVEQLLREVRSAIAESAALVGVEEKEQLEVTADALSVIVDDAEWRLGEIELDDE